MIRTRKGTHQTYSFYHGNRRMGQFELICRYDYSKVEVWSLSVFKTDRGLGTKMVKEMVEFIKAKFPQAKKVWLNTTPGNERARHVYAKVGFKVVGNHEFPEMELELCRH